MAKTTLTQLIEKWESETGSYIPNAPIYKAFIEEAKEFLEKEKEQIINSFDMGNEINTYSNGKDYYNETFTEIK